MRVEPPEGVEIVDHTADLALCIRAGSWAELMRRAAAGLYGVLGELAVADTGLRDRVALSADSREGLLHDWLAELLYHFEAEGFCAMDIEFVALTDTSLEARLRWHRVDAANSTFYREVKAITYHELTVEQHDGQWEARVILDI